MKFLEIQNTKVPVLGYGTWKLSGEGCVAGVRTALDIGYRHIDTAQIYENEKEVGQALQQSGVPRADIFLTTKVWMSNVRDGDLQRSVGESLARLRVDYIDLLLIHWPVKEVGIDEQMRALTETRDQGLTKLIGVSNFTVGQMRDVTDRLGVGIANNQVEYHPFLNQQPVHEFATAHGMFVTAYSPVARGKVMDDQTIGTIGKKYGKSPAQVTLRWLIQQDNVAAIPKAAKPENARANFAIFDFELSADEMRAIAGLARPDGRMVNPDWAPQWDSARAA